MANIENNIPTPKPVKTKQKLLFGVIVLIVSSAVIAGKFLIETQEVTEQKPHASEVTQITTSVEPSEDYWKEQTQNKLKEADTKIDGIKQQLTKLETVTVEHLDDSPVIKDLKQKVDTLTAKLEESHQGREGEQGSNFSTTPGAVMGSVEQKGMPQSEIEIENDVLNLKPLTPKRPQKNADTFVPAGTFAEAILLGAADASAGVTSSSKPIPMIFRIIADGTLPNHQKSHLKNCIVIGSVIGDISSERGEINLNRISCTFPNGEIVEQAVDGNIFGMDGKNGIRGNPVWREGALLGRAAVAGSLSGIATGVSKSYTTNTLSPLGSTQTVDNGAIFKYGMANGASNAMEKLAEYNIRRAEQYHPVIQITAGQVVDVVFIRGFYLDGKKHEESSDVAVEPEAFTQPASLNRQNPDLTLTEAQMEKIKEHEQDLYKHASHEQDSTEN